MTCCIITVGIIHASNAFDASCFWLSTNLSDQFAQKIDSLTMNMFCCQLKQDDDQIRIMYREGPEGTPFHTLLVEGYIDGPIDVCK